MASSALSSPSSLSGSAAISQSLKASFSTSSGVTVRHRRSTYRDVSLSSTENFFFDGMPHHFLDICSLCKKPLGNNSDIFMYRGDTPFCSEKCREERMQMDERREMKWEVSARKDKKEKKPKNKKSSSPDSPKIHVRSGAVVVG